MKMQRTLEKVSVLLLITFVMFSCEPEQDVFTPFNGEQEDIDVDSILPDLLNPAETFDVDNDVFQRIVTTHNTVLSIPESIFRFKDGTTVTGEVEIKIKELYSKGDLFMHRVPTVSKGRLIASGAVLNIKAFKDGIEVNIIPGKQIQINVENDNPDANMELFYGDSTALPGFDWNEADDDENVWDNVEKSEWAFQDSLEGIFGYGYECFSDSLQWINIDVFTDVPEDQKTQVCVELPEIYTNTNTLVAMAFKGQNSIVELYGDAEKMQFCEPYGLAPIGWEVTFIVLSTQGEEILHFATEDATITEDLVIGLIPEEKTKEEIKMILDGL